jgi:hypothetical protein
MLALAVSRTGRPAPIPRRNVFVIAIASATGLLSLLTLRRRRRLLEQAKMFDWTNWEEFEASLGAIFAREGYRAQLTA